jgi:hypothetical protein
VIDDVDAYANMGSSHRKREFLRHVIEVAWDKVKERGLVAEVFLEAEGR